MYTHTNIVSNDPTPPLPFHVFSCKNKNFKKKSVDLMAAVNFTSQCTAGYDTVTATPFWDCPNGGCGIPGVVPVSGVRQQGWYENGISIKAKVALAEARGLGGVGVWTATGASAGTALDLAIWDVFRTYAEKDSGAEQLPLH